MKTGRRGRRTVAAMAVTALVACVASSAAAAPPVSDRMSPTTAPVPAGSAVTSSSVPGLDHVYLVVMENEDLASIEGNRHAPYINSLIADYGVAARYTAVTHPSEPNYVALFAGGPLGVHGDGVFHLDGRSLADQLEAAGKTWHVYAQDYPGHCSQVVLHHGPVDLVGAAGTYARRHEPAISFKRIAGQPSRCAHITHLAGFDPLAADFELIVPNLINDMHDGTIAQGDAFLKAFVPYITGSPDFANSLLVITWDEGSTGLGGGRVPAILISPLIKPGSRSVVHHDHYSLLHTIQTGLGVGCLRHTCEANDLGELFLR